jgi:hypothetical protein
MRHDLPGWSSKDSDSDRDLDGLATSEEFMSSDDDFA